MSRAVFVRKLTKSELAQIRRLTRSNEDARIVRRAQMIQLSSQGRKASEISEMWSVTAATVLRTIQNFNADGLKSLADKPRKGRPRKTTDRYITLLKEAVQKSPRDFGYPFSSWTLDRLREHLGRQTGTLLNPRYLSQLLARHGIVYRRHKVVDKANDMIRASKYRSPSSGASAIGYSGVFKKRAVERDARFDLVYLDECEVHLHPTLTKVWTLKGTRPLVPAAGNNQRLCLYGAFDYKTGQVHYMSHPKKNSRRFGQFLSQLLWANADRFLILVLDNATYHRTAGILDILAEHEHHVFVVWLPKYSPELNAIEGLWGYLKSSALNNYFYGDMASLETAVDDAFRELQQHPETALSLAYKTSKNLRKSA